MTVKGIVIHNTNTPNKTAKDLEKWMKETNTAKGTHFFVDEDIVQVMPLTWSVWNTGKGMDFGNLNCISIEICSDLNSENYLRNEQNAVELIKKLMEEHDLTTDDIYFHRDFDQTVNCPADILKRYKDKKTFIRRYFNEQQDV